MDAKLIRLQKALDEYKTDGLPDFPSLLSLNYHRDKREDPKIFKMEDSWKLLVDADYQKGMGKKERELQEGIWELLKTEVNYIKQIRVIVDLYMCCLLNLQTEAIMNEIETEKIFSNITALEAAHSSFWKTNLKQVVDKARRSGKPIETLDVANAFQGFSVHFTAYFKFCADQENCTKYVRTVRDENELFRAFLEWCKEHPRTRDMRLGALSDLLVRPMQRVTKYHLLVDRICKMCQDETAKGEIKKTLTDIMDFVSHINHELKKEQQRSKLEHVATMLGVYEVPNVPSGYDELTNIIDNHCTFDVNAPMPNANPIHPRWLLLEGPMTIKEKSGRTSAYAFLFTDALLLTQLKKNDKYSIIRSPMRIDKLQVTELRDGSGFAMAVLDEYSCGVSGFVAQPDKDMVTVTAWREKIEQAKKWYYSACCLDEDEFAYDDEMSPEEQDVEQLGELYHDPSRGFVFASSDLNRLSSASCSSHSSGGSLRGTGDEEADSAFVNGEGVKMSNGTIGQVTTNNNDQKSWYSTPPAKQSTLIEDIARLMPQNEQNQLMSAANKLSVTPSSPEHTTKGASLSPKPPLRSQRIISFESDSEDEGDRVPKVGNDIYYPSAEGKKKEEMKKNHQKQRPSLAPTPVSHIAGAPKQPRPSLPVLPTYSPSNNASSPASETNANTSQRKSKFGWLKSKNKVQWNLP